MKNHLGQCTLRLSNIRPGLRRIAFRNERDNKENPMAIALVEIRMYTLAEIEEKTEIYKGRIEVKENHFLKLREVSKRNNIPEGRGENKHVLLKKFQNISARHP